MCMCLSFSGRVVLCVPDFDDRREERGVRMWKCESVVNEKKEENVI